MTERQREVLIFIAAYWKENGLSPTNAEIREGLRIKSGSYVTKTLDALEKEGYIELTRGARRNIKIGKLPEGWNI